MIHSNIAPVCRFQKISALRIRKVVIWLLFKKINFGLVIRIYHIFTMLIEEWKDVFNCKILSYNLKSILDISSHMMIFLKKLSGNWFWGFGHEWKYIFSQFYCFDLFYSVKITKFWIRWKQQCKSSMIV